MHYVSKKNQHFLNENEICTPLVLLALSTKSCREHAIPLSYEEGNIERLDFKEKHQNDVPLITSTIERLNYFSDWIATALDAITIDIAEAMEDCTLVA